MNRALRGPIRYTIIATRRADITTLEVDAIVNAANSQLEGGGGVDGAIHRAGGPTILEECRSWVRANGPLPTGEAMITLGGDLLAHNVIHTVGPIFADHDDADSRRLLAACYENSLRLAEVNACWTIAFPNISTGVYGYPKELAGRVAVETVRGWLDTPHSVEEILFVSYDAENERIYGELLGS